MSMVKVLGCEEDHEDCVGEYDPTNPNCDGCSDEGLCRKVQADICGLKIKGFDAYIRNH